MIKPLKKLRVVIKGHTPLLMNKFPDNGQPKANKDLSPERECEMKLHLDEKGKPAIPTLNLLSCIIEAGNFFLIGNQGKKRWTTGKETRLTGVIEMDEGLYLTLEYEDKTAKAKARRWSVDQRPVVMPTTKGRVIRNRPRFDDWKLSFVLSYDENEISREVVDDILRTAGARVGLGDFRPSRKGQFGKFKVVEIKPIK